MPQSDLELQYDGTVAAPARRSNIVLVNHSDDTPYEVHRTALAYRVLGQPAVYLNLPPFSGMVPPKGRVVLNTATELRTALIEGGAEELLARYTSDQCPVVYTVWYWPEDAPRTPTLQDLWLRVTIGPSGLLGPDGERRPTYMVIEERWGRTPEGED